MKGIYWRTVTLKRSLIYGLHNKSKLHIVQLYGRAYSLNKLYRKC